MARAFNLASAISLENDSGALTEFSPIKSAQKLTIKNSLARYLYFISHLLCILSSKCMLDIGLHSCKRCKMLKNINCAVAPIPLINCLVQIIVRCIDHILQGHYTFNLSPRTTWCLTWEFEPQTSVYDHRATPHSRLQVIDLYGRWVESQISNRGRLLLGPI